MCADGRVWKVTNDKQCAVFGCHLHIVSLVMRLGSLCRGDDYKSHVKCISEGQKYGGKDYEAKTHKGDAKQQAWIQVRVSLQPVTSHTCFLLGVR